MDATERYHFVATGLADLGGSLVTPMPNLTFSPQVPNVPEEPLASPLVGA